VARLLEPASEEVPADDGLPTLDICFWPSTKDRSRALQVRFSAAPIGVEFDFSQAPVRVKCVTCRKTAGLGIRRGMVVAKVGGVDATDMPSRKLSKLIRDECSRLPSRPELYSSVGVPVSNAHCDAGSAQVPPA